MENALFILAGAALSPAVALALIARILRVGLAGIAQEAQAIAYALEDLNAVAQATSVDLCTGLDELLTTAERTREDPA